MDRRCFIGSFLSLVGGLAAGGLKFLGTGAPERIVPRTHYVVVRRRRDGTWEVSRPDLVRMEGTDSIRAIVTTDEPAHVVIHVEM